MSASRILRDAASADWMLADALGIQRQVDLGKRSIYRIMVRDLVVPWRIGVYDHEKHAPQRVRINAELLVEKLASADDFRHVVDYDAIVEGIRALSSDGHVNLVETLAERILDLCLDDPRVLAARVGIEKLDVCPDAQSVGVWLRRRRPKGHFRD